MGTLIEKTAALGEARGKLADMELRATLLEAGVFTSTSLHAKEDLQHDDEIQPTQGLVATIDPKENAAVDSKVQNLQSTLTMKAPMKKGGADATIAHPESLDLVWEAVSTKDSSGLVPTFEDSSGSFNGPLPVVNSPSNRFEHAAAYVPKNIARVASSLNSSPSTFEDSNSEFAVGHQASLCAQQCLASAIPST